MVRRNASRSGRRGAGHAPVAVQAHPSATAEQLAAIQGAIATWDQVLRDCFDGLITLTRVDRRQDADIVVHYVPTVCGVVFGGYAICGAHAAPTSWSAPTCHQAWTASRMTPSTWAGSPCTSWATPSGSGMPPTCWSAPT
jgi:hypothetical protein